MPAGWRGCRCATTSLPSVYLAPLRANSMRFKRSGVLGLFQVFEGAFGTGRFQVEEGAQHIDGTVGAAVVLGLLEIGGRRMQRLVDDRRGQGFHRAPFLVAE